MKNKPTIARDCPKCGSTEAYGPEFRRGVGSDEDLGEHLRFYCTACRFMTWQPTKDADTPERRAELDAAFAAHFNRPRPAEIMQREEDRRAHERAHGSSGNASGRP